MKKLIILTSDNISSKFELKVTVHFEQNNIVASSNIKPIQPQYPLNNEIDEQALADYNCFIEDSKEELEDLGLEIKYSNSSNRSLTSRYFTLVDLDQDVMHTMKYMIFLRVSDHLESNSEYTDALIRDHRNASQEEVSREQGHKVRWKLREIIVNDRTFTDYDSAVDYIRKKGEEWINMLRSRPYSK